MTGDPTSAPTLATLMDWLEGRLPEAAAADVAARVAAGDEQVASDLCWLRGFLEVAAQLPLQPPPPLVRQTLSRHFGAWHQARTLTRRQRRTVVTRLLFDSRRDLPLALVRSAATDAEVVHLGYTSDVADVVVDVTPAAPGRVRVDGQVLPLEATVPGAFEVVVDGPDGRRRSVDGDEEGRFGLDDVPVTARTLVLGNADLELRVDLSLTAEADATADSWDEDDWP